MTQSNYRKDLEDSRLLFRIFCDGLMYGMFFYHGENLHRVTSIEGLDETINGVYPIKECKPCLRPLSSMTENEYDEFKDLIPSGRWCDDYDKWAHWGVEVVAYEYDETDKPYYDFVDFQKLLDWLNSHHFNYRSLIEKGLALEAPRGLYKS